MIEFIEREHELYDHKDWLYSQDILSVDTETTGLSPHDHRVIMFQIGNREKQIVIDTRKVSIDLLKNLLEDTSILKILHNSKFDWKHIYSSFGIRMENIHDTFIAERIINNGLRNQSHSLDKVIWKYIGEDISKEVRSSFSRLGNRSFSDDLIKYGAKDVEFLDEIYKKQMEKAWKYGLTSDISLHNKFIITLSKMELNGFFMDPKKWKKVVEQKKKEQKEVMKEIDNYILKSGPEGYIDRNPTLFSSEPRPITYVKRGKSYKYIFSSQAETVKFMNSIGIDTKVYDEVGNIKDSVKESNLKQFEEDFPFVTLYLKYKKLEKSITSFGYNFLDFINKNTGRIHSEYFPFLNTGRISSNKPNLQQIPSSEDFRSCFTPQRDDNVLVVSDFSQQEPRVVAHLSKDSKFIDFFNNGSGDSHSFVASIISEFSEGEYIEVSKENNPISKKFGKPVRDIGKMINLSLNYGKTAKSLKDDLGCSEEDAQKVIDTVQGKLEGLREYFTRIKEETFRKGYIPIDRKTGRKFFLDHYDLEREEGKIGRAALNFPVQGTSASITKYAMLLIQREIDKRNLPAWMVAVIHDEIVVECRESISDLIADIIKEKMEGAGEVFCPSVKLLAEPVITNKWEH